MHDTDWAQNSRRFTTCDLTTNRLRYSSISLRRGSKVAMKEMHETKSTNSGAFFVWSLTQDPSWGDTAPRRCLPVYPWRGEETTREKRKEAHVKTANIITWYRHSAGVRFTSAVCFSLLGGCSVWGFPQTISTSGDKSHIQYAGVGSLKSDLVEI